MGIVELDNVHGAMAPRGEGVAGFSTRTDADLPGYRRFCTEDPFSNRIEVLQLLPG